MSANQKDNLYINIRAHLEDLITHAKPKGIKLKGCKVSKSLLMKENQLCVPDHKGLRLEILKKIHNQLAIGHSGVERTLNMIRRHYYWLCIRQTIEQYVWNCHIYRKAKVVCNTYNGLLQPLLVSERLWVNVIMDFMTGLLKCHAYGQIYDAILMVIDWLSKKCHYILCTEENKGTSAEAIAELFMQHV